MKDGNPALEKSFTFAVRIVKLCRVLVSRNHEYVLSKQLLRSGTSIGANLEEAMGAQSTADFYAKVTIAYKEARESSYWIRLLEASTQLNHAEALSLLKDIDELMRIIGSIQIATRKKILSSKISAQRPIRHS